MSRIENWKLQIVVFADANDLDKPQSGRNNFQFSIFHFQCKLRHRFPIICGFLLLGNKKAPASPSWETRTGIPAYATLLAAFVAIICRCRHISCPYNGGKSSEDTKPLPFPLPSAVHLLLRFSPHFHQRGLSVDAPAALSPRLRFAYWLGLLNTINVFLSRTILHIWRTCGDK